MNVADMVSRMEKMAQQSQAMANGNDQFAGWETAVRQLEAARQQWQNQITWHEGLDLSSFELQELHKQLEEQDRLWHITPAQALPEAELDHLQETVAQAEAEYNILLAQEKQLVQLEGFWQRWQTVAARQHLATQVTALQAQWQAEQAEAAQLLTAYDQLQMLIVQVQAQKERYAAIEEMIQVLDDAIAGDQKEAWLKLAFVDINKLGEEIGTRLYSIEEGANTLQQQAEGLQQGMENADKALEPVRQHVADLRQQEQAYQESFAGLPEEMYRWGQDRKRLKLPKVDGESAADLETLLKGLQAEQTHLQWFEENVAL